MKTSVSEDKKLIEFFFLSEPHPPEILLRTVKKLNSIDKSFKSAFISYSYNGFSKIFTPYPAGKRTVLEEAVAEYLLDKKKKADKIHLFKTGSKPFIQILLLPYVTLPGALLFSLVSSEKPSKFTDENLQKAQSVLYLAKIALMKSVDRSVSLREFSQSNAEELKTVFENLKDLICVLDFEGNIIKANNELLTRLGFPENTLYRMKVHQLYPAHQRKISKKILKNMIENEDKTWRVSLRSKNGTLIPVETAVKKAVWRGKPAIFSISRDISERLENERKLKNEHLQLLSVFDSIEEIIYVIDPESHEFLFSNKTLRNLFGDLIGQKCHKVINDLDDPCEFCPNNRIFGENLGKSYTWIHYNEKTGKWYKNFNKAIKWPDGKWVRYELAVDITQQKTFEDQLKKAKEEAETATKTKSQFLANMSHEIRTPLNGIIGMLNILENTELSEEQKDYIRMAVMSSHTLLSVVNEILDFSKIEAGKFELEEKSFNLEKLIRHLLETFRSTASEKGIELIFRYDPDAPNRFVGDENRIRQILFNFIGNSLKFTEKGHVLVDVEFKDISGDKATFKVSVQDTGIGIPKEKKDLIFEDFTQVDSSTTRKYGGTGLGLSIAQKLVKLMNGAIEVKSEPGKGSDFSFSLTLPVDDGYFDEDFYDNSLTGVKVAVVDDNLINLKIFSEFLQTWNVRFETFTNAPEALQAIYRAHNSGEPFRAALLDYLMPEMDGEALGRAIKSDPRINKMSLIMMSSVGNSADRNSFMGIGFSSYLSKPVSRTDLYNALIEAIGSDNTCSESISALVGKPYDTFNRSKRTAKNEFDKAFNISVLLVEDNLISQKVVKTILEKLGCRVHHADNGLSALEMISSAECFDIVFMDLQMPEMDGYKTSEEIRKFGQSVKQPVIIALTANIYKDDKDKCLNCGMDDYLRKPVTVKDIKEILDKWTPENQKKEPSDFKFQLDVAVEKVDPLIFSIKEALKRYSEQRAMLKELVDIFLEQTPGEIESLTLFLSKFDYKKASELAHAIKGGASYIGAEKIREISQKLEESSASENFERSLELLNCLKNELISFETAVNNTKWDIILAQSGTNK